MPKQRPGETISQFAIRTAWETGQFWDPADEEGLGIKQSDLPNLSASDPVVVRAMIRMAKIDMNRYAKHVLDKRPSGTFMVPHCGTDRSSS